MPIKMKLAKIKQLFPHRGIESPQDEFLSLLNSSKFKAALSGRKRIAIAIGSRGISNLVVFVSQLVDFLKELGIEPVIAPAMGSHGFAAADGQTTVLNKLGINRDSVDAEIISSMDVISLGQVEVDGREYPVYVDSTAWQYDGVILLNRVKTHTDFTGRYESGLVKMATVGLGNHEGAKQVHSLGTCGLKKLMPSLAKVVFSGDKVVGGFGIIEDAYHKTAGLHWLDRDEILDKEPQLLEESKSLMPHLPINDIDLLIIKQMGKEISGTGIDPKIVGRSMIWGEQEPACPNIELISICDITRNSYGNALGMGLSDFITRRLFDKIDFAALKENIFTTTFYQRGKTPLVLENEQELIDVCLRHFQRRGEKPKIILIKDTLNLSDMYISEAVLDELGNRDDIELVCEPKDIAFDNDNRIMTDF